MEKSTVITKEITLGGRQLKLETGALAKQANAAVVATYGETVVLATVVAKDEVSDMGYFPLAVDYEERHYASGRISTSRFIKREGRPSEIAVLTSRLIDRSIRPLFPKDYQQEVQVIITVLSIDNENDPAVAALIATSAALTISDIPWNGPISGLKVGSDNGKYVLNPLKKEGEKSSFQLLVVSNRENEVVMIEAEADQADEEFTLGAIKFGIEESKNVIRAIDDLKKEAGVEKKKYKSAKLDDKSAKDVTDYIERELIKELDDPKKAQDEGWFESALEKLEEKFASDEGEITKKVLANILDDEVAAYLRNKILTTKKRIDGRGPDELRPLSARVAILPRTHGSGLFERGDTQVLSLATLASPALQQLIEGMSGEETKKYMHYYNFPPFSAGEVKRAGSPGRREIGHGALAEKALIPVLPTQDEFPYTIRIVSEVLSSAGSTSMAAASGSTLALMDAGVPIKEPVGGISIGLVTDKTDRSKFLTLTDIAYQEDAQGDMDFKVAGTKRGITAIQLDIKLDGISTEVCKEALEKAKVARLKVIETILKAIAQPRKSVSKHAPTVILIKIDPTKIGDVIGSGGRIINKIIAETGAQIDIEDEGTVTVSAASDEAARQAATWIEGIVREVQPGEVYEGAVKRILPFGAMVEILPGKEGLIHISKMAPHRIERVEDVMNIGDTVNVKVAEIDDQRRINLALLNESGEVQGRPQEERKNFGENRGRFDRGPRRDNRRR